MVSGRRTDRLLELRQATSGCYSDSRPVFDPEGRYLYYLSNRSLEPLYSDLDDTWIYPNTTELVAVALRSEVASPLAPRSDEEAADDEDGSEDEEAEPAKAAKDKRGGKAAEEEEEQKKTPEPVEVELDGFEQRAVVLPPEAGNFAGLRAVSGMVVYHRQPRSGSSDEAAPLAFWDLEPRSVRYLHNPTILAAHWPHSRADLFALGANAVAALGRYRSGDGEGQLLVVEYRQAALASRAREAFAEALLGGGNGARDADDGWYATARLPGEGDVVAFVLGADSAALAGELLGAASRTGGPL